MRSPAFYLIPSVIAVVVIGGVMLLDTHEQKIIREFPDPALYLCTDKQLDLVRKEANICRANGYKGTYCCAMAKSTQCPLIEVTENADDTQ